MDAIKPHFALALPTKRFKNPQRKMNRIRIANGGNPELLSRFAPLMERMVARLDHSKPLKELCHHEA